MLSERVHKLKLLQNSVSLQKKKKMAANNQFDNKWLDAEIK